MSDAEPLDNPIRTSRPTRVWGAFALLAIANAALVVGGAWWLTGQKAERIDTTYVERATDDAEKRAAALAKAVLAGKTLDAIVANAKKLDAEGVDYELAGPKDGRPRVLAASEKALIGQPPDGGLIEALKGKALEGEIALPTADEPKSRYTAHFVGHATDTVTIVIKPPTRPAATKEPAPSVLHGLITLLPTVVGADGKPAPAPQASASAVPARVPLRVITRKVKKKVPGVQGSHVVRPGDTLYKISRQHYGDASMFEAIWKANLAKIPNRSNLISGTVLVLPATEDKEIEVEERVTVYPSTDPVAAAPAPTATPTAAPTEAPKPVARPTVTTKTIPVTLGLRLSVPVATRSAVYATDRRLALGLAGVGAVGVLGAWWFGALLLERRRRRELAAQHDALLAAMAGRFRPHAQLFDRNAVRSPWQVEHAAAVVPGDEPGGGFTDFRLFTDTRLGLFIGDATGSAMSAPIHRGVAGLLWRTHAKDLTPPGRTLLEVNRHLVDYVPQGDHVTAFYAQVDLLSGAVTYAAAAHTGAFVLGRRGGLTMLSTRGMPLGVGQELFADRLEQGHVRLAEGESLLLFTDGLLKAENDEGEPFGVERLEKCLRERPGCNADEVVATVRQAVEAFTGHATLDDEAAILCLRLVNPLVLYPKFEAVPITQVVPAAEPEGDAVSP